MDTFSHGLAGMAIAALRRPSGDETDRAVLYAGLLGAEAPDVDVLLRLAGLPLRHRTWTHTLVAAPFLALCVAALLRLAFRRAPFAPLYGWSLAGVLFGHLLLDFTTYGVPLLGPWSWERVRWDLITFFDPVFLGTLLAGAVVGARRRRLVAALRWAGALAALYLCLRGASRLYVAHEVERQTGAPRVVVSAPIATYHLWRWTAPGHGSGTALVFPPRLLSGP